MSTGPFELTFWGVRGSVPSPGKATAEVGGNTSCVELRVGRERIIFDGGTGLRPLGESLREQTDLDLHVFFSHVHWDHIQGVPFFAPSYHPGNRIAYHAARRHGRSLRTVLEGQMSAPYFPITMRQVEAALRFHDIDARQRVHLGDVTVHGVDGNHPDGVFAWRVEYKGHSVVYATDTESTALADVAIVDLARGADVLIYDAQYTPEEYEGRDGHPSHVGWGHSTMLDGARIAREARVGTLVLFHHDPGQSDAAVAVKESRARGSFERSVAAREGLVLDATQGFTRDP